MARKSLHKIGEYSLGVGNGFYVARWYVDGKEKRSRLGIAINQSKSLARDYFTTWVRLREKATSANQNITIGDIFERFLANREVAGTQISKYRYQWSALRDTFQNKQPDDIKVTAIVRGKERTICHEYADMRKSIGRRRATIWSELVLLRTMLNWAEGEGLIDRAPKVFIPKVYRSRQPNLSIEDCMTIIDCAVEHHIKIIFTIALFTGQRKGAITELTWDQVNFDENSIQFDHEADRDDEDDDDILDEGHYKGRGYVGMHHALRVILLELKEVAQTDHVVEYLGKPVKDPKRGIKAAVDRAKLAGVKIGRFVGVHAFRHAFATHAADLGIDMRIIQKALGHDDIDTTRKTYAKHTPSYTLAASEAVAGTIDASRLLTKKRGH